jgi:hypothetical protein
MRAIDFFSFTTNLKLAASYEISTAPDKRNRRANPQQIIGDKSALAEKSHSWSASCDIIRAGLQLS